MEEWEIRYEKDLETLTRSGPNVFTEKQRMKNIELRDSVRDLLPIEDDHKVSDCDLLYRFLIGKKWSCKDAEASLRSYVTFRKEEDINGILAELPDPQIASILAVIYGVDKAGHPVIWTSPEHATLMPVLKAFDNKVLMRAQIQTMEQSRFIAKARGVDRCTYVIDFKKITLSSVNSTSLKFLKSMNKMLQDLYPEIISRILIFNAGWAITSAWKLLMPLVDQRVQEKVKFFNVSPSPESLRNFIDIDNILPVFGGTGLTDVLGDLIHKEERRLRSGPLSDFSDQTSSEVPQAGISTSLDPPYHCRIALSDANPTNGKESLLTDLIVIRESTGGLYSTDTSGMQNTTTSSYGENVSIPYDASFYSCRSDADETEEISKTEAENPKGGMPAERLELSATVEAGTLVGYCDDKCIGMFFRGRVYCQTEWPTLNSPCAVQKSESNASSVMEDLPKMLSLKIAPLENALSTHGWFFGGELLRESKHPIHNYLIICDAMRNAKFVLKKSIVHRKLTIFRIVGNTNVITSPSQKHTVKGKHIKIAVVVPPTTNSGDDSRWMILARNSSCSKLSKWFLPKRFSRSPGKQSVEDLGSSETMDGAGGSSAMSQDMSSEKNELCGSSGVIGFLDKDVALFQGPLASTPLPITFLILVSIRLMWDKMKNLEECSLNT